MEQVQHPIAAKLSKEHTEKRVISMHEGVEVWQDCCCCEAEPYWVAAFADEYDDDNEGEQ